MTPTPRTDAFFWILRPQREALEFARQLERENQTFRAAQKACEDCDAPRVDRIDELERELAAHRALADKLAETLANVQVDYFATGAIMLPEVDAALVTWGESQSAESKIS